MSSKADDLRQWAVYYFQRGFIDEASHWLSLAQVEEIAGAKAGIGAQSRPPEQAPRPSF